MSVVVYLQPLDLQLNVMIVLLKIKIYLNDGDYAIALNSLECYECPFGCRICN
jgi:hypothetical protein